MSTQAVCGSSSISDVNYMADLDRILEMYEKAAQNEQFYLLYSTFKLKNSKCEIGCGLSPARSFSPVITLKSESGSQLVFSTYEWANVVDVFKQLQREFFQCDQRQLQELMNNQNFSVPIQCSEFISISKLVYDQQNGKQLMIMKQIHHLFLGEEDVSEIIRIDFALLTHQLTFLDNLNFCGYYYNILDVIRNWISSNKTILNLEEIISGFCEASNDNSICNLALKQYLYYYKNKIFSEVNK